MNKGFKKVASLLLALLMVVMSCCVFAQAADGTYETSGQGNNGPVAVKTTIEGGKITAIELGEHTETAGLGDVAAQKMIERIVAANSIGIDAIAGTTKSSKAVLSAVEAAIVAAGGDVDVYKVAAVSEVKLEDRKADVLIIGSGAAGLSAANAAVRNGKNVLVIEKNATPGGATAVSGGGFIGGGSKLQKEWGYEGDSPDLIYADLLAGGIDNDETMLRLYAENAGVTVDWMYYDLKLPLRESVSSFVEHSVPRSFAMEGGAVALVGELKKAFESMGGTVLLETKATKLLTENGKVVGAAVDTPNGGYDIFADSVILATGGYGANKDLLPDTLSDVLYYGVTTATGDGLLLAREVGAAEWYMDHVKVYPQGIALSETYAAVGTGGSYPAVQNEGAIYVNTKGVRVVNENAAGTVIRDTTRAQDDKILWLVMDAPAFELWKGGTTRGKYMSAEQIDAAVKANGGTPTFANGATLEEAAASAAAAGGVDAETLVKTVEAWNESIKDGVDEEFGNTCLFAIDEGPFYIVKQNTRFASTLGGLKIDTGMHVLDTNDQPIEGLYAAGEVVGGAHGQDSMPTSNVGWALTTGRLAGEAVCVK